MVPLDERTEAGMAQPEVACIWKGPNELGESPNWNCRENALYWVDINGQKIQRLDPETDIVTVWDAPMKIGSIVFREQGGLVAGMHAGFHFVDLETGSFTYIIDPDPDHPSTRLSDGKCDRRGRYWCGSMDMNLRDPLGALYRLDTDLSCTKMAEGVVVSNGLGWSPDDKVLYYANSRGNTVYAFDFDIETGEIENRRDFISTGDIPGRVDGATVDTEGCYWAAHIDGWEVAQYDPQGQRMRTIPMPVRYPSMCSFGGKNLDVLYVTSIGYEVQPGDKALSPLGGALFAIYGTDARGIPEPFFAG